jgi:hypothetical protein
MEKCEFGCGRYAGFVLKNGRKCCSPNTAKCPGVRAKMSEKQKEGYAKGRISFFKGRFTRKGKTKENDETVRKASETLRRKYNSGELKPSFLGKHHTEESKKKIAQFGGLRRGAGRGKRGWYKGYWCDSTWELAFVVYNLEHNIEFHRNRNRFEYEFDGKRLGYYPDFKMGDGKYVEVKGYYNEKSRAKVRQFSGPLVVLCKKEMEIYLSYVIGKYGKDFVRLYDGYVKPIVAKSLCPKCGKEYGGSGGMGMCHSCAMGKRRKKRPSLLELSKLVGKIPMVQIGTMLGVSDNTIRHWCKDVGIDIPRRKMIPDVFCSECGKATKKTSKTGKCHDCYIKTICKTRPSREDFDTDCSSMTLRKVAGKYGISHSTVIEWKKDFGL